jgi:hypothetical protein
MTLVLAFMAFVFGAMAAIRVHLALEMVSGTGGGGRFGCVGHGVWSFSIF